jgi:hypothetical protein
MHERCDRCGRSFDVLAIIYTGSEYLCRECAAFCQVRLPEKIDLYSKAKPVT